MSDAIEQFDRFEGGAGLMKPERDDEFFAALRADLEAVVKKHYRVLDGKIDLGWNSIRIGHGSPTRIVLQFRRDWRDRPSE